MKASIWHNPRCSKSREALAILQATPGVEVEIADYLQAAPSRAELEALFAKAGVTPAQALRKGEAVVKEIGLNTDSDSDILHAMSSHPILIERPIVITERGAVIARPPEKARDVL